MNRVVCQVRIAPAYRVGRDEGAPEGSFGRGGCYVAVAEFDENVPVANFGITPAAEDFSAKFG